MNFNKFFRRIHVYFNVLESVSFEVVYVFGCPTAAARPKPYLLRLFCSHVERFVNTLCTIELLRNTLLALCTLPIQTI